jgi:hypothetical protein
MLATILCAFCASTNAQQPSTSAPAISVTRYSDMPLSEYQNLVMNEATKLSLACRIFRGLYGRWPTDLSEIQTKTDGINFAVFMGRAVVTPLSDDSERIEIFDGENKRTVKAVPVELGTTDTDRKAAKVPGFKIKV